MTFEKKLHHYKNIVPFKRGWRLFGNSIDDSL